jgi:signal transduction histidine kinase
MDWIRSHIGAPIFSKGQLIGFMNLDSTTPGFFTPVHADRLQAFANQAAIAIENARLYDKADRRAYELEQQAIELQTRNEELDAFAHTVAHDLKNPVGPVVGFAEILIRDHTIMTEDERQRCMEAIARSGRKIKSIIEELLLLAEVRQVQVATEPLDMSGIVSEALQRLTDAVEQPCVEIVWPDVSAWPVALGYAPWVEEVWINYLSNALKYGGRPPRIELGAKAQPDGMTRFWVRDNGPGIPPEAQARLFTPFTRLDQVRARGHGLGLSIVRRIVEKLGGQVGVESQVGQGSVFSFTLPGAAGLSSG